MPFLFSRFRGTIQLVMTETTPFLPTSSGYDLDPSPEAWGELKDSSPLLGVEAALRERINEEGYLYIRDYFPREIIEAARRHILEVHSQMLDPNQPLMDGILDPDPSKKVELQEKGDQPVRRVVFGPEIIGFYEKFLGGAVRPFDFIWYRAVKTGVATKPHCDLVYMGRGTRNLYTAWIPYGDVSYEMGGLMILEKSNRQADRIRNYLSMDVDTYCENDPSRHGWKHAGYLSTNPASLREKFHERWLTAEFRMGDLLTFRMDTVHASTDNRTNRIRLSTDTRYQLASDPIDERWIGEKPIGHGPAGKRGKIC